MYNNLYSYNPQANIDRINNQIQELERMKSQIPQQVQPTNLTQNFQITPSNNSVMKYANSIDEVQKNIVIGDTPFFSNDLSIVWIKNTKGEIKTYELTEIIPKDEKDIKIEYLQAQIEELKKEVVRNESDANTNEPITEPIEDEKSSSVPTVRTTKKK